MFFPLHVNLIFLGGCSIMWQNEGFKRFSHSFCAFWAWLPFTNTCKKEQLFLSHEKVTDWYFLKIISRSFHFFQPIQSIWKINKKRKKNSRKAEKKRKKKRKKTGTYAMAGASQSKLPKGSFWKTTATRYV